MNFFRDINEPTINELVYWFQVEFTDLADSMKESNHNVTGNEPNAYHIEDSIWTHTMMVCQRAEIFEVQKINKICALLHDIGKPLAREVIPFEAKKPVHTESNELRNKGKNDGKTSGMNRVMPKSGLKCHFRGHEGLSFYLAIEPLNRLKELGVLTQKEVEQCLVVISKHGQLFDNINEAGEMVKPSKVFDKFENSEEGLFLFNTLVTQVKCDSLGRFFVSKDGRKSNAHKLGTEIYTEEQFLEYYKTKEVIAKGDKPSLTVMVGVPGSGKSTFLKNLTGEYTIISRDDILMQYAIDKGIIGKSYKCPNCNENGDVIGYKLAGVRDSDINLGKCLAKGCNKGVKTVASYSEVWNFISQDDQKEIDSLLEARFKKAFLNKENMVIDQTNMSNKSQRKWVNKCNKKYNAKAVVMATSYSEVYRRLYKRADETGKFIPIEVVKTMMKSFGVPDRSNFTEVEFVF